MGEDGELWLYSIAHLLLPAVTAAAILLLVLAQGESVLPAPLSIPAIRRLRLHLHKFIQWVPHSTASRSTLRVTQMTCTQSLIHSGDTARYVLRSPPLSAHLPDALLCCAEHHRRPTATVPGRAFCCGCLLAGLLWACRHLHDLPALFPIFGVSSVNEGDRDIDRPP